MELPEKYDFKKNIGEGVFGAVMLAQNHQTRNYVAIKRIFAPFNSKIDAQRMYREIAYLKIFNGHPNIIKLIEVVKTGIQPNIFLVFDLMNMDLQTAITNKFLSEPQKRYVSYQLFRALNYIHSINVTHRDLKPSNILLNNDCQLKLADFGLVKVASRLKIPNGYVVPKKNDDLVPMTEYIATRWYRAPELLVAAAYYTTGIDIWSAGCIIAEVMLGRPLFPGMNSTNQVECIMCALPTPPMTDIDTMCSGYMASLLQRASNRPKRSLRQLLGSIPDDGVDLLENILTFQPQKRPTAGHCMQHIFLSSYFEAIHLNEKPANGALEEDETLTTQDYKQKVFKVINMESSVCNSMKQMAISSPPIIKTNGHNQQPIKSIDVKPATGMWW